MLIFLLTEDSLRLLLTTDSLGGMTASGFLGATAKTVFFYSKTAGGWKGVGLN